MTKTWSALEEDQRSLVVDVLKKHRAQILGMSLERTRLLAPVLHIKPDQVDDTALEIAKRGEEAFDAALDRLGARV